jgi:hypothetical protein
VTSEELLKKFGFKQEIYEEYKDQYTPTSFPYPLKRYRIVWEMYNMSMEEAYFWFLRYVQDDWGFNNVVKTIDVFAAAENSAFFGVSQQRIGLQQDKVSQFLATIGKMVKELFQLVRELRIIDERLNYYEQSIKGEESAEITLKGYWVDLVEGGAKNPSSVFGMAREVQFTSLPDLFFSTHPRTPEEVDKVVDTQRAGFNKSVRNALKRKLRTYMEWKRRTHKEMGTRRTFTLKYLRQHYDIIKMYMTWVRPYLRHIRRLTLDEEKILTPDMVSAFEGSMVEVEFLAHKLPVDDKSKKQNSKYHSCILCHFLFRTRPSMSYQQEGYQRGPIHVGKLEVNMRAYVWTEEEIKNYVAMKKQEDFELMKSISGSVKAAMTALGDEIEGYLEEAGEAIKKEKAAAEEKPATKPTFFKRVRAEFLGEKKKEEKPKKPKKQTSKQKLKDNAEIKLAKSTVKSTMFYVFKNFKKGHRMIMW